MKLKDIIHLVEFDDLLIGVYNEAHMVEEFPKSDNEKVKEYEDYMASGIWILNESTLCTNVYI